jgi:HTH-type transcriptional regulator/antitoxin HigA
MENNELKYTVIKGLEQYDDYCLQLEGFVFADGDTFEDHIDLLTVLIEKWDSEHTERVAADPIELLVALMDEHALKQVDVAALLGVSKSLVSSILAYRKGMSKSVIRKLANYFKIDQAALNKTYRLTADPSQNDEADEIRRVPLPYSQMPDRPHMRVAEDSAAPYTDGDGKGKPTEDDDAELGAKEGADKP